MKKKFSWKSYISFGLFFFFFILLVSGIILYITPPGRIANWTDWQLFGLTKPQWQAMHTNFAFLFAILSIFHLFVFNWKVFWSYLKTKTKAGLRRKREFILATSTTAIVFAGVVFLLPPFSTVMDVGENFKEGWEEEYEAPPVPHAEEFTIAQLSADILKIPEQTILFRLDSLGIVVDSTGQSLKELALQVELSPQQIYRILSARSAYGGGGRIQGGGGMGRKSLKLIAEENNIPVEEILSLLAQEGIDATEDDVIRDLADIYNISPSEVLSILNMQPFSH